MEIITSVNEMGSYVDDLKSQGKSIGFVPTLGFLHKGHQSLMRKARSENDALIVSTFVNPLQFREKQYWEYPRDLERDKEITAEMGVDAVFVPCAEEMFPTFKSVEQMLEFQLVDFNNRLSNGFYSESQGKSDLPFMLRVPKSLSDKMDGKHYPWHFDGVATVVYKLFKIIEPNRAYFGEKDIQQLAIIRCLANEFSFDIEIRSVPIVREKDGLAYSSRNSMLSSEQRNAALIVNTALEMGKELIQGGESQAEEVLKKVREVIESEPLVDIDYVDIVDSLTLESLEDIKSAAILYIAYKLSVIRLADTVMFAN